MKRFLSKVAWGCEHHTVILRNWSRVWLSLLTSILQWFRLKKATRQILCPSKIRKGAVCGDSRLQASHWGEQRQLEVCEFENSLIFTEFQGTGSTEWDCMVKRSGTPRPISLPGLHREGRPVSEETCKETLINVVLARRQHQMMLLIRKRNRELDKFIYGLILYGRNPMEFSVSGKRG